MSHACHRFWKCYKTLTFCSLLARSGPSMNVLLTFCIRNVLRATTACTFSIAQLPKVLLNAVCVLYIFTSKCASRHNGVHFFNISTSKNALALMCFVRFYFGMCFAPQRCALFQHLIFQKCSGAGVFCTFLLAKCASRHNGVQ